MVDEGMTPGRSPQVSVIVPHHDDLAGLDRCLMALAAQRFDPASYEVIVCDNASRVGEAAVFAAIAGRARLVVNPVPGAGPTRNTGVAASRGAILAFTDSDCVPDPGWLAAGIAALASVDFAGGRMDVLVDGARKTGSEAFEQVFAFNNRAYVERKGFTVTANLFCPRALFDAVGGFGVGLSEDLDWCHRARGMGYRIGYADGARVGHPARRDWPALLRKWRRINAESRALVANNLRGRAGWLARTWALPLSIPAHAPRILRHPALRGRERIAALAVLARLRLWRFIDGHRRL